MTTAEMLDLEYQRTKISDRTKLLRELQVAYRWAVNEIYKSADGPPMLVTVGEQITALVATTRNYDLESALTGGSLLGIKQLWLKLTTDTAFTLMVPKDITDSDFTEVDNQTTADPLIATGHPVYYAVTNFGQVRFAPALPSGAIIRADYSRIGPQPDPTVNPTQEDGTDLPSLFHDAICHKGTALLLLTLDDDRAPAYEAMAITTLNSAIYAASKAVRANAPVTTQPFRRYRMRRVI